MSKKTFVYWPGGGKTGPHVKGRTDYEGDVEIEYIDRTVLIPEEWTKDEEPEIEENRFYYVWDDEPCAIAQKGWKIVFDWEHIEPVHRRWDELDIGDKSVFTEKMFSKGLTGEDKYKIAYELITGEKHP